MLAGEAVLATASVVRMVSISQRSDMAGLPSVTGANIKKGPGEMPAVPAADDVMTVLGPVEPGMLGMTLMHEHLFLDLGRITRDKTQHLYEVPLVVQELSLCFMGGGFVEVSSARGQCRRRYGRCTL
ncbi:hypothetical protein [Streptomyces violascens]|uniref:hypothetical protein n=1 Tax=Streptomyces violascens TaxID=67381 RepID=UPI001677AF22|nr:hypothetical protein [Streptomyces violascens]GGU42622.1 hypothetical protein GCM10010289_74180 [Streptomyces violascens]